MSFGFTPQLGKTDRRLIAGGVVSVVAPGACDKTPGPAKKSAAASADACRKRRKIVIVVHSNMARRLLRLKRR